MRTRTERCNQPIDRTARGNAVWVPTDGGPDPGIKRLFTRATAIKLATELER